MSVQRRIGDEDLVRASALASSTERANRSVTLLSIAIVFCLVSLFSTIAVASSASESRDKLERQVAKQESMLRLEAQLNVLGQSSESSSGNSLYPPEPQLRAKLNQISNRLGIDPPANLGNIQNQRLGSDSPLVNTSLVVTLTNVSSRDGMRWLELAQQEVSGLEIKSLDLRPTELGWTFRVQLGRWEARP